VITVLHCKGLVQETKSHWFFFLLLLQSVGTIVCFEGTLGCAGEVEKMLISVQINALS
jgi:hypothetical protein